ncbi:hypothetical protein SPRG_01172 [Saprolegnia parasitica CBS 223.65]|uniref:Uncharacterized protein n=1 Tax=Saprolegnia parasitica (strain CBS 223.65) TaxID=695850 RepID=A0A067D0T6_SAPPC|nr:hypothetical protein SPRG_01172 [Saprolegnia parasitica CBS 223.65]KDO35105.1 hypothetical protein SPRG_01172 [Saprolegnia parasitica CBS 223.65]|eukprot:XP_012194754.1 hypothetical protein SPRG_01172 [Saprolegnia parasitica CBS 223.65]
MMDSLWKLAGLATSAPERAPEPTKNVDGLWTTIDGAAPSPRSGHASVVANSVMYVLGGYDKGQCFGDIHAYDLTRREWSKVDWGGAANFAAGCASHAMCVSPDETSIYVYGGSGPRWGAANRDKLLQFTLSTQQWSVVATAGTPPPPGYGQSMVAIGSKLYLFGGTSGHDYHNDLFVFDATTSAWSCAAVTGAKPSPRYKHGAVVVGNDMYIVGGGLYGPRKGPIDLFKFDTLTSHWTEVVCVGDVPPARLAHSVVLHIDSLGQPALLVFGGRDFTEKRTNGLWSLHLPTATWTKLVGSASEAPDALVFHTAVMWQQRMVVFGGTKEAAGQSPDEAERSNALVEYCGVSDERHWVLVASEGDDA